MAQEQSPQPIPTPPPALSTAYLQASMAEQHAREVFNAALKALRRAERQKREASSALADYYQKSFPNMDRPDKQAGNQGATVGT